MSRSRTRRAWLAGACAALALSLPAVGGAQPLIWQGEAMTTLEGTHLTAHVPAGLVEQLREFVARADQVYGHLLAEARYNPRRKLALLIGDWIDDHNGYSFVTPYPLVQLELAPALAASTIFDGHGHLERTLVHELAHHISNDRNHGLRAGLERIFGRVVPFDLPSLIVFLASTPAHQTMPSFWHEGLANWAETEYADPRSPWTGRGRDALTHMVWRLDQAAGALPAVDDWRITYHRWPFGNQVYAYGLAYTRYLHAALGDQTTLWELIEGQGRSWPYFFQAGAEGVLARTHAAFLAAARAELAREQEATLALLRSAPVRSAPRATPVDAMVAAPGWLPDGSLVFNLRRQDGRPELARLYPDGTLEDLGEPAYALAPVRTRDGVIATHEFDWRYHAWARIGAHHVGPRLREADVWPDRAGHQVLAIRFPGGLDQELVWIALWPDGRERSRRTLPTQGRPWSPAFRPGSGGELVWVETDASGSRLVLAPAAQPEHRRILHVTRARIVHPAWSPDGRHLYFCSDVTGVSNAYRLTVDAQGVELRPVTNTIGGVVACVPSPDGTRLALVDHDHDGPYIGFSSADPQHWASEVPTVTLPWPAPITIDEEHPPARILRPPGRASWATDTTPLPPPDTGLIETLRERPYRGLRELRPWFWTPTTLAAPYGGYGVAGWASDPLMTQIVAAGGGFGLTDAEPVGFLGYASLAGVLEWGATVSRDERTFADEVVLVTGAKRHYTETLSTVEVRVGRGVVSPGRRWIAYLAAGYTDHAATDDTEDDLAGFAQLSRAPFDGDEHYLELVAGYGSKTFFPISYAPEDGLEALVQLRRSAFGGDLERSLAFANASYSVRPWSGWDHQAVVAGQLGWSDGERFLQGTFAVGGSLSRGLPRGYVADTEAVGRHLMAGSAAYRIALWQPFRGLGTTPFRARQLVLELYVDTANVADDHPGGSGDWFTSVGGELLFGWEFDRVIVSPGVGLAQQLDADRDTVAYLVLGFRF